MAKARIMVVEDEALIVLDLQNMLKNMGYDVSDPARSASLTRWRWAFRHTHRLSLIDENQIVINDLILAENSCQPCTCAASAS